MQPQNPQDPFNSQQPPQPVEPVAQPIQQPAFPDPVQQPTQQYSALQQQGEDPGKQLSLIGVIVAIFIPLIGIILSAIGRSKSKAAGYDGKLGLIGIIVGSSLILLSVIAYIVFFVMASSAVNNLSTGTSFSTGSSSLAGIDSDSNKKEAFGVKLNMARDEVEAVLGEPEATIKNAYSKPCTDSSAYADGLGYDTVCTYKVGAASQGSSVPPHISVQYLKDKLVTATEVAADGKMTTLSKNGVTSADFN